MKNFNIPQTALENICAKLELSYRLIQTTTPIYSKYSFKPGHYYVSTVARDSSSAAKAVKHYATRARSLYSIDVDLAANSVSFPQTDIV
jgi:hypothetical protein